MISKADLCLFGLETTDGQGEMGPARKRTGFMTSSWTVAEELQRTCDGKGHAHNPLLERRAKGAEVYPPELCRAICRGVSRQKLMDETGQMSSAPMSRGQVSAMIGSVKWKDEVHEDDGGHDVGGQGHKTDAQYCERRWTNGRRLGTMSRGQNLSPNEWLRRGKTRWSSSAR